MSYDFTKLSNVDVNQVIEDSTYSLVVNGDEVQKASFLSMNNSTKNYYTEYTEYLVDHSSATPIDFIRSLSPILVEPNICKERIGYLLVDDLYYYFKVYGEVGSTFYNIQETDFTSSIIMNYLYNSTTLISSYQVNDFAKYFYIEAVGNSAGGSRVECLTQWSDIIDAIENENILVLKYKTNVERNSYSICFLNNLKINYTRSSSSSPYDIRSIEFLDFISPTIGSEYVNGIYKTIYFYKDHLNTLIFINDFDKINTVDGVAKHTFNIESTSAGGPILEFDSSDKYVQLEFDDSEDSISFIGNNSGTAFNPILSGIGAPVYEKDAVNKKYADEVASSLNNLISTKLDEVSPSALRTLTLTDREQDDNDYNFLVINKEYADSSLNVSFNPHGDLIFSSDLGDIYLNGLNVYSPVNNYNIVNKKYVDDSIDGKIDSLNGSAIGTLSINKNDSNSTFGLSLNSEADNNGVHEVKIGFFRNLTGARKNREIYLDGYDYTQNTSFIPILNGIGDPEYIYDAANKQYVDFENAEINVSNTTTFTVSLDQYKRKRCYLNATTKTLGFADFSSSACEECFIFFKTKDDADFRVSFPSTIYLPTLEDGTAFTFERNTYYSIHFTRGFTANGYRTFADIKRYRTVDIV
jgi:hypothetical protein